MIINKLENFEKGWVVGNFDPAIFKSSNVEVGVKQYKKGERESSHYQLTAIEVTIVISGKVRLGAEILDQFQIATIFPLEEADFECLEDSILVCIKSPSCPNDKVIS